MKITPEIKVIFEQGPVAALATLDENGIPNVSIIASKKIIDENTIWTIDTFHKKTLQNIQQNGNIALAIWKDGVGYQIKGKATHYTEGDIFEKGKAWILTIKPQKIVKGVIEIKVKDIFYLTPDYKLAGERVGKE